jgi:hypothetical protein
MNTSNKKWSIDDLVFIGKGQIIRDIAEGVLPRHCPNFSELHDFVDANEYSNFCHDAFMRELERQYGWNEDREPLADLVNDVQGRIDEWLKHGGQFEYPEIVQSVREGIHGVAQALRAGEPEREAVLLAALHCWTPQQILMACCEELNPHDVRLLAAM